MTTPEPLLPPDFYEAEIRRLKAKLHETEEALRTVSSWANRLDSENQRLKARISELEAAP